MKVLIPTPLRSYTGERREVEAHGSTLSDTLDDLERQYPGILFRMVDEQGRPRRHMRIFINGRAAYELSVPVSESDEIVIVQALSGG